MSEDAASTHRTDDVRDAAAKDAQDDGADDYSPDPRRWRILAVTLVVGFMTLLDVTIVNVAIPSIREGLDSTAATVQWVVSGYALTFGLTLVAGGRLGDAFGRRRLLLVGLVLFIVSSAAVGFAPTAALVVAARLVQGAAAGLLTPQSSGLIQELFRGDERGQAFGYFGLTVSVASATGPLIGGLIIAAAGADLGWRFIFLVNVPIGIIALFAVARMVPRPDPASVGGQRIDFLGAGLLGLAVLALLYPMISVESGSLWPLVLLVGVPVFGIAFVRWEHHLTEHDRAPLLDLDLLRRLPGFGNGLLVGTLYFTGFTGVFLTSSVWLQESRGVSPLHAALLLTPFAIGSGIASPLAGRVVGRIGRPLTVGALATMMAALLLIITISPGQSTTALAWAFAPFLLIAGLGGGAVVSPNITLTLKEVPTRMGGAAGGALQTGQRIGAAIGAALLMTVYGVVESSSGGDDGLRVAFGVAVVVMASALLAAIRALRMDRTAS